MTMYEQPECNPSTYPLDYVPAHGVSTGVSSDAPVGNYARCMMQPAPVLDLATVIGWGSTVPARDHETQR